MNIRKFETRSIRWDGRGLYSFHRPTKSWRKMNSLAQAEAAAADGNPLQHVEYVDTFEVNPTDPCCKMAGMDQIVDCLGCGVPGTVAEVWECQLGHMTDKERGVFIETGVHPDPRPEPDWSYYDRNRPPN